MRTLDCAQGSREWIDARIGVPTASNFDRLITPKTCKPSASADKYLARLLAEWFMGVSLDETVTQFMERGTDLEPAAASWYEAVRDTDTKLVGLCLRDDGKVGASPDRLVGEDGLLEIKCPSAEVHMVYHLYGITDEYKVQAQGQLWITGRRWVDLISYHPILPRVVKRVERDDDFIGKLAAIVEPFLVRFEEAKADLAAQKAEYDAKVEDAKRLAWESVPAGLS